MATDVAELLRKRYPYPEWALLFEVRNATGYTSRVTRYADAMAMNLWPSRGLEVLGFEIKSHRGDWIRELKNPAKAETIQAYCDKWWIVAEHKDVVKSEELPPTWGLLVAQSSEKGKLICMRDAPVLAPKLLDRTFIASMLRRANEQMLAEVQHVISDSAAIKEAYEKGKKVGEDLKDSQHKYDTADFKALQKAVKEFEEASGVQINKWDGGDIGNAVKAVLSVGSIGPDQVRQSLDDSIRPLKVLVRAMEALKGTFQLTS